VNLRVLARRTRRLVPLAIVLLGAGGADLVLTGSAGAASSNCFSDFASRASLTTGGNSGPCESFGFGSASVLDIKAGDFSQLRVTSDPPASLELRANLDPPVTCLYQRRVYEGLSGDQYNIIVNGGDTTNEPTLHITLSTAVPGGLSGAQLIIARGQAQVCFGSPRQFPPKPGSPEQLTNDPGIGPQWVALLPDCAGLRVPGPCITGRTATQLPTPTGPTGVVNIFVDVPPGFDPRLHA
jgi:hypothetical protein